MKPTKSATHSKARRCLNIVFDKTGQLTSYAGLVLFSEQLGALEGRLRRAGLGQHRLASIFGLPKLLLVLVVHVLLGFRRLRGLEYYGGDPLVTKVLGLKRMPSVSTVSRGLQAVDAEDVEKARDVLREQVLEDLDFNRIEHTTVDFDGTSQLTSGLIEGTAVGFNKSKAGRRSYHPLFATVAQTGQFLDLLHRPGNAHDSHGASWFMALCFRKLRARLPSCRLDTRMDSAFFDQSRLEMLDQQGVEFTCSVPFERMPKLKRLVETRRKWVKVDADWSCAEVDFEPTTWKRGSGFRFILVRRRTYKRRKGIIPAPLQLDLFTPISPDYRYKVIVTNKIAAAADVLRFHNGRGGQERIFGEAKQNAALGVIATRRRLGNEAFTVACMLAHNMARRLQMQTTKPAHACGDGRPLWNFAELGTIQLRILHVAGRVTNPARRPTLAVSADGARRRDLERFLRAA